MAFKEFTTVEKFHIYGRGDVHIVTVSDEDLQERNPRDLVRRWIKLDGEIVKVRDVETPCIPWQPGSESFRHLGLLVHRRNLK